MQFISSTDEKAGCNRQVKIQRLMGGLNINSIAYTLFRALTKIRTHDLILSVAAEITPN
jgi:hypothetical protein